MKGGGRSLSHLTIVVLCLCRSQFYAVGNNPGGGQRSTRSLQSDLMQQYSGDYRGSDLRTRLV